MKTKKVKGPQGADRVNTNRYQYMNVNRQYRSILQVNSPTNQFPNTQFSPGQSDQLSVTGADLTEFKNFYAQAKAEGMSNAEIQALYPNPAEFNALMDVMRKQDLQAIGSTNDVTNTLHFVDDTSSADDTSYNYLQGRQTSSSLVQGTSMYNSTVSELSNLISEAYAEGLSDQEIAKLYPGSDQEFFQLLKLVKERNAYMTGSVDSEGNILPSQNAQNTSRVIDSVQTNPYQLTPDEFKQVNDVVTLMTSFTDKTSKQEVEDSGLSQKISALNPNQLNYLYAQIAMLKSQTGGQDLKPPENKPLVDPSGGTRANNAPDASQVPSAEQAAADAKADAKFEALQKSLDDAEKLMKDNKSKEAYDKYSQILKDNPTLASSWPTINYYIGQAAEYSGDDTLIPKAKEAFEAYVASKDTDKDVKKWVQEQLDGGLESQGLLTKAGAAYNKQDYDKAFEEYNEALTKDPGLADSYPDIYYQLGTSAEYAKSTSTNQRAGGYYAQYLAKPRPTPVPAAEQEQIDWVRDESKYLEQAGPFNDLVSQAQDALYKSNKPERALSKLRQAVRDYPQAAEHNPDVYYSLGLYAYSSADIGAAKSYLQTAEQKFSAMLTKNPDDEYAKYYMDQIKELQGQVNDPWNNLTSTISSWLGDKMPGSREFWREFIQGTANGWFNKGRAYSYTNNAWESKQVASHWDSVTGGTGFVKMDTPSQKAEFDQLNSMYTDAESSYKTTRDKEADIKKNSDAAVAALAKDPDNEKLKTAVDNYKAQEEIAHESTLAALEYSEAMKANRDDFTNSFDKKNKEGLTKLYGSDRVTDRPLAKVEQEQLYTWDKDVRTYKTDLAQAKSASTNAGADVKAQELALKIDPNNADAKKKLEEAKKNVADTAEKVKAAEEAVHNAEAGRTSFVEAAKKGQMSGLKDVLQSRQSDLNAQQADLAKAQEQLAADPDNKDLKDSVKALEDQVKASQKSVEDAKSAYTESYDEMTKPPINEKDLEALKEARTKYGEQAEETKKIIDEHDALIDEREKAEKAGESTTALDQKIEDNAKRMTEEIEKGKEAQRAYAEANAKAKQDEAALGIAEKLPPKAGADGQPADVTTSTTAGDPQAGGTTPVAGADAQAGGTTPAAGGTTPVAGADAQAGGTTPAAGGTTPVAGADAQAGGTTPAAGGTTPVAGADAQAGGGTTPSSGGAEAPTTHGGAAPHEGGAPNVQPENPGRMPSGVHKGGGRGTVYKGPIAERQTSGTVGGVDYSGRTGSIEDMSQMGPGWWGIGDTIDHQQAAAFSWHLGTGSGGKLSSGFSGPGTNEDDYDPGAMSVSIDSGGSGATKYNVGINGGVNVGNVEHRDFKMIYGGSTGSGIGVGGMVGTQSRADVIDEEFGIDYEMGETDIGGEHIDNLVTTNATEQAAVGAQGDADVSFGAGTEGASVGAGAGGFAGAQVAGMAGGTVDGVGGNAMGQAWAGVGAKANANLSMSKDGKLNFDIGAGAALGIGAYVDLNISIDFNTIAKEIKGSGQEGVDISKKWGDKVPGLGHVAGFVYGSVLGVSTLALATVNAVIAGAGNIAKGAYGVQDKLEKAMGGNTKVGQTFAKIFVRGLYVLSGADAYSGLLNAGSVLLKTANESTADAVFNSGDEFKKGHIIEGAEEFTTSIIMGAFNAKNYGGKARKVMDDIGGGIKKAFSSKGW